MMSSLLYSRWYLLISENDILPQNCVGDSAWQESQARVHNLMETEVEAENPQMFYSTLGLGKTEPPEYQEDSR